MVEPAGTAPAAGSYGRFLTRMAAHAERGMLLGLDRVRAALRALGEPQRAFTCVQVAGTNGKGSTVAMLEAICRQAGLRTGRFTSPHLARFTERIVLSGREIDGAELDDRLDAIEALGIPLTYFELTLLIALVAMRDAGVEIALLETGLGGRLDAVTATEARLAAITSIGLDHTAILGPTVRDIAREKAAIARPGQVLVLGAMCAEAEEEVRGVATRAGAQLLPASPLDAGVAPALAGRHQLGNAAVAWTLARAALPALGRGFSIELAAAGLRQVRWPGRLEWIGPLLFDAAHNEEGALALAAHVRGLPAEQRPRTLLLSCSADKDVAAMCAAWAPVFERFVVTALGPRAVPVPALVAHARAAGARAVEAAADPFAVARAHQATGRPLCVAGSLFLVGPLRARLLDEPADPIAARERVRVGRDETP